MSKPKDRTGEFMRQHKRILEERSELLTQIDTLKTNRERDIAKAVEASEDRARVLAEELARVTTRNTELAQLNASQVDCIETMKTQLADRQDDTIRLMDRAKESMTAFEVFKEEHAKSLTKLQDIHNAELATLRAAIARMDELGARIEERGKKKEQEEARALLNRKVMAAVVPQPRRYR
jgi:hypothetical protein